MYLLLKLILYYKEYKIENVEKRDSLDLEVIFLTTKKPYELHFCNVFGSF